MITPSVVTACIIAAIIMATLNALTFLACTVAIASRQLSKSDIKIAVFFLLISLLSSVSFGGLVILLLRLQEVL